MSRQQTVCAATTAIAVYVLSFLTINDFCNVSQGFLPAVDSVTLRTNDGYVRHCITGEVIGKSQLTNDSKYSIPKLENISDDKFRYRDFIHIFQYRHWANKPHRTSHSGLSSSGSGSTLDSAQETVGVLHSVISQLKQYLGRPRVRLLDLACGDMQWMSRFLETRADVDYTGFEIVPGIIGHHRRTFAGKPWTFKQKDMISSDISFDQYDLILVRQVLMHLQNRDVQKLLSTISAKTAVFGEKFPRHFILVTTYANHPINRDLNRNAPGRHHKLNLEIQPYSLTSPLCLSIDGEPHKQIYIGLWSLPLTHVHDCVRPIASNSSFGTVMYSCTTKHHTVR